jgi:hypothetical protein
MAIYYQLAAVISAALRGDRLKWIIPVWNGVYHEMTGKTCNSDEDRVRREETRDRSADKSLDNDAPISRAVQLDGRITANPVLGGLQGKAQCLSGRSEIR